MLRYFYVKIWSTIVLPQVRRQVQEFDLVITSGGIGPTHDDITIYSVARALNQSVRENKVCYPFLPVFGVSFVFSSSR